MTLFVDNANMISIYLPECCFTQFSVANITVVSLPRKYIFDAWFFTRAPIVSGWSGFYGVSAANSVLCDEPSIDVTLQWDGTSIFAGYMAPNWGTVVPNTQSRWWYRLHWNSQSHSYVTDTKKEFQFARNNPLRDPSPLIASTRVCQNWFLRFANILAIQRSRLQSRNISYLRESARVYLWNFQDAPFHFQNSDTDTRSHFRMKFPNKVLFSDSKFRLAIEPLCRESAKNAQRSFSGSPMELGRIVRCPGSNESTSMRQAMADGCGCAFLPGKEDRFTRTTTATSYMKHERWHRAVAAVTPSRMHETRYELQMSKCRWCGVYT